jgi:hypothetical protein
MQEDPMAWSSHSDRRRRVARGIYQQPNGRYAVCIMVDRQPRFRTLSATTMDEARRQRELLQSIARMGELPVSPRLTFAEVAARWVAEFEAKVAASERRDRTLDLYRSQLRRHLLPRLGPRRLALITSDDVVAVMRELQADGLSPWTIKRILGALSCVFTFALRRGYIARILSTGSSATSGRIRCAPTNASSPAQSSRASSPPVRTATGRCSSPGRTRVCVCPRCSG